MSWDKQCPTQTLWQQNFHCGTTISSVQVKIVTWNLMNTKQSTAHYEDNIFTSSYMDFIQQLVPMCHTPKPPLY